MKNRFFSRAVEHAAGIAGKKKRLLLLLTQLGAKLNTMNWNSSNAATFKEKIATLGRLVKAYAVGDYREVSWKTMLSVTAAILYFLNPFDLLPDVIPITGFADDFGVLVWVYNSIAGEIDKFLVWEQSQLQNRGL